MSNGEKEAIISINQDFSRIVDANPNDLKGVFRRPTLQRLLSFEEELIARGEPGLLDWLRNNTQRGINPLAKQVGVAQETLSRACDIFGIPHPSQSEVNRTIMRENLQNPDFAQLHAERARNNLLKLRADPDFQAKLLKSIKDPEYRKARAEDLRRRREDPGFIEHMFEAIKVARQAPEYRSGLSQRTIATWQDSDIRERRLASLRERFRDPIYRARLIEAQRVKRLDTEWSLRVAEASRRARLNPANIGRYYLPTIHGYRRDIDFYAQSAWEANFARVLMYNRRDFYTRESFRLSIPPEDQGLFTTGVAEISVDFVTLDRRGNSLVYEIMAHPKEDPVGWRKLELLAGQYPEIMVRPILPNFYRTIQRRFAERINSDLRYCGWETQNDNLRNNPGKYGRLS